MITPQKYTVLLKLSDNDWDWGMCGARDGEYKEMIKFFQDKLDQNKNEKYNINKYIIY